ncbi:MAG: hypothetical protein ACK5QW_02905 [Cyanobacteriota bacterium]|jgi:hypothetical protein
MASNFSSQFTNDDRTDAVVIRDPHTRSDQRKRDAMNTGLLRQRGIQRFLTWQTGLPHSHQSLQPSHPLANLAASTSALVLGLLCCNQALLRPWPWWGRGLLLLIGWGAILSAMRNFRLPNRHSASHGHLTGKPQLDARIGQVLSAFLLTAPMSRYINSHVADASKAHHKWTCLMTPGESTFEEIRALGFQPGVPNAVNWSHLKRLLLSPHFYGQALATSLHDTFCTGTLVERSFTTALWLLLLFIALATHHLLVLLVAYTVPRLLYEACQVLRVLIEHTYAEPSRPRTLATYKRMTSAIILADPVPVIAPNANPLERSLRWLLWSLKMLMHFGARTLIATGDVVNHPTHHLRPGASFINHEIERMKLIQAGHAIPSNWGLVAAIEAFFTSLSKQPRDLFLGE